MDTLEIIVESNFEDLAKLRETVERIKEHASNKGFQRTNNIIIMLAALAIALIDELEKRKRNEK